MTNNIEFFFKNVYQLSLDNILNQSDDEHKSLAKLLVNEFKSIMPSSSSFHNYLEYELPSIDKMYENDDVYNLKMMSEIDNFDSSEMHEEYNSLLIDAFNIYSNNKLLGQMTLLLISRYYSENAEFIRNLDRMELLFDDNDYKLNQWAGKAVDRFVEYSEKSSIWFTKISKFIDENTPMDKVDIIDDVVDLELILHELK